VRAPTGAGGSTGDVDGLLDQHAGVALGLELGAPGVVRGGDGRARR
jgi:hypothetical protein